MPGHDGHRLPLSNLPSGVEAWLSGPASSPLRDRRGHLKAKTVDLRPTTPRPDPAYETDLADSASASALLTRHNLTLFTPTDLQWLLGARSRSSAAWEGRHGARTLDLVHALVAAGVVHARYALTPNLNLGPLIKTELTPAWRCFAEHRTNARHARTAALADRAHDLSRDPLIAPTEPALAATLAAATGSEPRLLDLLHAAADLIGGVRHDGPRAFSQQHFGDSKSNDDIDSVLRAAGATPGMLDRLGLVRAQYVGLAGPIRLSSPSTVIDLTTLRGPTMLRTDQEDLLPALTGQARVVVVVENLQAAETLASAHSDVAIIHTNGQPGDPLLRLIAPILQGSPVPVHVICDADLGGCRIAARILTIATNAMVHDIGSHPHTRGRPFAQTSLDGLNALAESSSPVAGFAAACLARGYVVEQEAATRAATQAI